MFSALTDEPTARVVEFQQNNPNASNTELARFIRDTGADVNLVADALDIDRDTATQMYQDALGSEFETARVAQTEIAGGS